MVCAHSSDEGMKDETAFHHCSTPLPAIQQQPTHNVYSMPVDVSNINFMPGNVPVLPVLLPWQHTQVPHSSLFDAQHNTTENLHNIRNRKTTKKEPWFKKFKYRYIVD